MNVPLASGLWSEMSSGCIKHEGLLWVTSPLGGLAAQEWPWLLMGGGVYVLQKAVIHCHSHCILTPRCIVKHTHVCNENITSTAWKTPAHCQPQLTNLFYWEEPQKPGIE